MKKTGVILFAVLMICSCRNTPQPTDSKKEITVSILPQKYFVEKIAGTLFKINIMVPPGASPATYEPTPSQLIALSESDLYLKIGYTGFEMAWMEKLAASNTQMKIINLSEGIDLLMEASAHDNQHDGHGHGGIDPHIWLSPVNVKLISQNIYNALSETYPEFNALFKENLELFSAELDSLDHYISTTLSGLNARTFFTYHPALSYFARDYNLEQLPLELGGKTPSAAHMKSLIDAGRQRKIGVVFLQMQFDQRNAEVLANEIGAEIVQINPLDEEWSDQMVFITDKLKENIK